MLPDSVLTSADSVTEEPEETSIAASVFSDYQKKVTNDHEEQIIESRKHILLEEAQAEQNRAKRSLVKNIAADTKNSCVENSYAENVYIESSIAEISTVTNPPELQSLEKSETSLESNVTVVEKELNQNKTNKESENDQDTVASVSELLETDSDPLSSNQLQSFATSINSIPQSIDEGDDSEIISLTSKIQNTTDVQSLEKAQNMLPSKKVIENMSLPEEISKAQFLVESGNISTIEAFLSSGK